MNGAKHRSHGLPPIGMKGILPARDDISSHKTDGWSETPLRLAADDWYEGIANTLPERNDINPDTANHRSPTPFFQALKNLNKRAPKQLR